MNESKQFDHVSITHPNATMARRSADFVLMLGAVNIDETIPRIRVVFLTSIEPKNAGHNQVLRRRERIVRPQRYAASEYRTHRHVSANLFRDAKMAGWRFETALLSSNAKP